MNYYALAADYLEQNPDKWEQRNGWIDPEGGVCMGGAVMLMYLVHHNNFTVEKAVHEFNLNYVSPAPDLRKVAPEMLHTRGMESYIGFNDREGQTVENVIKRLRELADERTSRERN